MDFFFKWYENFFFKSKLDDGKYIYVGKILHQYIYLFKIKGSRTQLFLYIYVYEFFSMTLRWYMCVKVVNVLKCGARGHWNIDFPIFF